VIELPERITGAWLNALSPEQKIAVLRGPFGQRMHMRAGSHVTYIRWARESVLGIAAYSNGSVFFIDVGGSLFAVTAAHVYEGYLKARKNSRRIICHIENVVFDPERRLRGLGQPDKVDIATFDFTHDELKKIGKQALVADPSSWPPPHPFSGQGAFIAGFPGISRLWTGWRSLSFGLYTASTMINVASEQRITCPFAREYWIDVMGHGLPPRGYDLGGISGGPLLTAMDEDGVWDFQLAGVVSEAKTSVDYETVVSIPAHFIGPNGEVYDWSAPVRHAVRAV
jgi:hypothetical protein